MATRISIGFHASPPLSLRLSDDELAKLKGALGTEGWLDVSSDEGDVTLALQHVLYLRVDKDAQKVGFGLGAA